MASWPNFGASLVQDALQTVAEKLRIRVSYCRRYGSQQHPLVDSEFLLVVIQFLKQSFKILQ